MLQREQWRVVQKEAPDNNGVLQLYTMIEIADGQDCLGVTRWQQLTDKNSSWTAWRMIAEDCINEKLGKVEKRAGRD